MGRKSTIKSAQAAPGGQEPIVVSLESGGQSGPAKCLWLAPAKRPAADIERSDRWQVRVRPLDQDQDQRRQPESLLLAPGNEATDLQPDGELGVQLFTIDCDNLFPLQRVQVVGEPRQRTPTRREPGSL